MTFHICPRLLISHLWRSHIPISPVLHCCPSAVSQWACTRSLSVPASHQQPLAKTIWLSDVCLKVCVHLWTCISSCISCLPSSSALLSLSISPVSLSELLSSWPLFFSVSPPYSLYGVMHWNKLNNMFIHIVVLVFRNRGVENRCCGKMHFNFMYVSLNTGL